MSMKTFLTVTAIIEGGAGLALLAVPSLTASLLLGMPLDSPAAAIARVGGAAISTLALACWLARGDAERHASRSLAAAMLFYNVAVAAVLAFAGFDGLHGVLLWPAVAFHVAMGAWCVRNLQSP
jgi:hypothetical protein